jgi:hypothetical protein
MGEKGMESPAPLRPGVAGAGELMAPIAGIGNIAAGGAGASMAGNLASGMQQAAGGSLGDAAQGASIEQAHDALGQPPKG